MNKILTPPASTPVKDFAVCPHCGTGILHIEKKTFFKLFGDDAIAIPDFPFWKCRICKWTEYDVEAIDRLINLLGVNLFKESGIRSIKLSYHKLNKGSWLFWNK